MNLRVQQAGRQSRRGYTLLELILVLAVLIMLAALAVPMAMESLDSHRLRASADRVQAAFADARNLAIRSGNEVAFYYMPGARTFFVTSFNPLVPKPLPPIPDEFRARDGSSDIRSNILEMGVRFAGADVSPDARSQMTEITDVPNYQRILFYPDGSVQPARLFLANEVGAGLRVELRGLTGTSVASEIMHVSELQ
jgi:prepilin-type N-terminal cleavage/methylation domain-containing protein